MTRALATLNALLLAGALAGCGVSADAFDGWWAHVDDDGTVRALHFFDTTLPAAETRDDYELFVYADGPQPLQSGTVEWVAARQQWGAYAYEDGALITTPFYASDPALEGQSFTNEVLSFDGDSFELASSDGGSRRYEAIEELP